VKDISGVVVGTHLSSARHPAFAAVAGDETSIARHWHHAEASGVRAQQATLCIAQTTVKPHVVLLKRPRSAPTLAPVFLLELIVHGQIYVTEPSWFARPVSTQYAIAPVVNIIAVGD
jgi:hypothetical protein